MVSSFSFDVLLLFAILQLLFVNAEPDQHQQQQIDNPRCAEPRDKGVPCSDGAAPAKKFYFNPQKGACQPFIYQGCAGTLNRFDTAAECRKECARSSGGKQDWVLAERCNNARHLIPDGRYIECAEGEKCPEGHECSPEGGVCCPTKEHVCSLQDDSGTFAEGVPDKPRFAWSDDIKVVKRISDETPQSSREFQEISCWRFSYFGAKGNYNNFPTFQDCLSFCGGVRKRQN